MRPFHLPLTLACALACAPVLAQDAEQPPGEAPATEADTDGASVPLDEIRRFVAVFNMVREAYVEPVDDRTLMQSAVEGLLQDLDPHSAYLEADDSAQLQEMTRGAFEGIGVEMVRLEDGTLRVIAPIDDTPAARAGIKAGDVIVAIDGEPIAEAGPDPLGGPPGSEVVLSIARDGRDGTFDVPIVREVIRVPSIRARLLEPGFGYVRIAMFQADTGADFATALDRLETDAGGALRGLVIDVRSNPGGLLTTAVQVADELLERGTIVSTRGRVAIGDTSFSATPGDRLDGAPVVVLVDAGSASAAEVLAGALRDNDRARVVGSRTFGKGSVQTALPLDNGDTVKLTTARYYTPDGTSIQARGIAPDVVLQPTDEARDAREVSTEATLPGHLDAEGAGEAPDAPGDVLEGQAPIDAALAELKRMAG